MQLWCSRCPPVGLPSHHGIIVVDNPGQVVEKVPGSNIGVLPASQRPDLLVGTVTADGADCVSDRWSSSVRLAPDSQGAHVQRSPPPSPHIGDRPAMWQRVKAGHLPILRAISIIGVCTGSASAVPCCPRLQYNARNRCRPGRIGRRMGTPPVPSARGKVAQRWTDPGIELIADDCCR